MNRIQLLTAFLVMTLFASAQTSIHDFSFKTIDGKDQSFADFKGKKILIVNTASECGYTPQYEGLQALHEKYKDKVVVIGFRQMNLENKNRVLMKTSLLSVKKTMALLF